MSYFTCLGQGVVVSLNVRSVPECCWSGLRASGRQSRQTTACIGARRLSRTFRVRMLERICQFLWPLLAPPCGNWQVVTDLRPTLKFIHHDSGGPIVFSKSLPTTPQLSALERPFMAAVFIASLYSFAFSFKLYRKQNSIT